MVSADDSTNALHQDEAAFRVKVTQEANKIKTKCKKLFIDLDASKEGTIEWQSFNQLLTLQGIRISEQDR